MFLKSGHACVVTFVYTYCGSVYGEVTYTISGCVHDGDEVVKYSCDCGVVELLGIVILIK